MLSVSSQTRSALVCGRIIRAPACFRTCGERIDTGICPTRRCQQPCCYVDISKCQRAGCIGRGVDRAEHPDGCLGQYSKPGIDSCFARRPSRNAHRVVRPATSLRRPQQRRRLSRLSHHQPPRGVGGDPPCPWPELARKRPKLMIKLRHAATPEQTRNICWQIVTSNCNLSAFTLPVS